MSEAGHEPTPPEEPLVERLRRIQKEDARELENQPIEEQWSLDGYGLDHALSPHPERSAESSSSTEKQPWWLSTPYLLFISSMVIGLVSIRTASPAAYDDAIYGKNLTDPAALQAAGACADELWAEEDLLRQIAPLMNDQADTTDLLAASHRFGAAASLAEMHDVPCELSTPANLTTDALTPHFDVQHMRNTYSCADDLWQQLQDPAEARTELGRDNIAINNTRTKIQAELAERYDIACE